jgi:hypothetical protein
MGHLRVVGGRRGPSSDVIRARELYESGMTAKQVGEVLGVSKDAICTNLSRIGAIRPGPPKKPRVSTERSVQLRLRRDLARGRRRGRHERRKRPGPLLGWLRAFDVFPVSRLITPKAPKAPKPDPSTTAPKSPRWSDDQLLALKSLGASHRQVNEATGPT